MLVDVRGRGGGGGDKRRDHLLALFRRAVCQYTVVGAEVPVLSGSLEREGRGGEVKEREGEKGEERRGGKERGRGEGERRGGRR